MRIIFLGQAKARILKIDEERDISRIEITIHEGKNREVRKMCNAINKKVLALHRSRIENLYVKDLKLGQWRYLKDSEVEGLLRKTKREDKTGNKGNVNI